MRPVTLADLKRVLVTLESRRFSWLVNAVCKLDKETAGDVPLPTQVALMLADWMSHLGCLSDHQMAVILEREAGQIDRWCKRLAVSLKDSLFQPLGYTLTISETRWVRSNYDESWLDLDTEKEVAKLPTRPSPPVTHISCDVLALYARASSRLEGSKDADKDRRDRRTEARPS